VGFTGRCSTCYLGKGITGCINEQVSRSRNRSQLVRRDQSWLVHVTVPHIGVGPTSPEKGREVLEVMQVTQNGLCRYVKSKPTAISHD